MSHLDSPPALDVAEKKGLDVEATVVPHLSQSEQLEWSEYTALKEHYDNDPKAYKKLIRKMDIRIVIYLWFIYLMNALDRSNAGNVRIYTFFKDTNMTDSQFTTGLTIYSCFYGGLEVPAQLILQRIGPKWFLSTIVTGFGVVTALHTVIGSHRDFWILRAFLGIFEAGIYQGSFYVLSRWFLPSELQKRQGIWYTATMVSGALGGLIAYGVGGLQGRLGYQQWQWLFIIEGTLTIFVGVIGFLLCPGLPGRWKSRFFTSDEMRFMDLRVKYKDGPIPPRDVFEKKAMIDAAADWKTYIHASLLAFGGSIPTYSINYTLALMIRQFGYTAIKAQALTVPPYIFGIFCVLLGAWYSDRYQKRAKMLLLSYGIGMCGILVVWPCLHFRGTAGASYAALFFVVGAFNAQGPAVGALATNFRNPVKRAVAMGIVGTLGQIIGGVGGANIFRASEAPTYPTGFGVITGSVILGGVLPISAYWYILRRENKRRDAMAIDDIKAQYTEQELSDMGERSPLFRYVT